MSNRSLIVEITGMHCASCAILVDDCIEDLGDVVSTHTDLRSGRCVSVVADTVSDAAVLAAIAEAGYAGTLLERFPPRGQAGPNAPGPITTSQKAANVAIIAYSSHIVTESQ